MSRGQAAFTLMLALLSYLLWDWVGLFLYCAVWLALTFGETGDR